MAPVTDVAVRSRLKRSKSGYLGETRSHPKGNRMSLFPFRRLLVGALGAALTLAVLVSVPGTAPAAAPAAAADPSQVTVTGLKVNGRTNPLGIPGGAPSFSWHGESAARGVVQTAYQIQVATSAAKLSNPDIWNSNRKTSNRQVDVLYQGAVGLNSQTRYFWRVRTWDGQDIISDWSDAAWFETGMLSPADWGTAEWIGAPDGDERPRWQDYTADFTFTIDNLAFGARVRAWRCRRASCGRSRSPTGRRGSGRTC